MALRCIRVSMNFPIPRNFSTGLRATGIHASPESKRRAASPTATLVSIAMWVLPREIARGLFNKPPWKVIWAILGLAIAWHCWFASYNHDEIQHLHAGWLISAGQLPYRDFLENHHPTLWFLSAPIIARFDSVKWLVFAARAFDALCLLGLLTVFRRILARVHPAVPWQLPTLLLLGSFIFVRNTLEFRPDPSMNVLVYAALLNWMAFLQGCGYRRALAAGALFGVAVAVLQKALVVLGLVCIG